MFTNKNLQIPEREMAFVSFCEVLQQMPKYLKLSGRVKSLFLSKVLTSLLNNPPLVHVLTVKNGHLLFCKLITSLEVATSLLMAQYKTWKGIMYRCVNDRYL